jgi:hypothetical protein
MAADSFGNAEKESMAPSILLCWDHRIGEPADDGVSCACYWSRTSPRLAETVRRGLAAKGFVVDVEHDGVDAWAAAETLGISTWWSPTSCCRG